MANDTNLLGSMRPWVEAQIAAGRFATEADAVEAALVNLAAHDAKIKNLQHMIQAGLDAVEAGDVHEYASAEEMVAEVIRRRF